MEIFIFYNLKKEIERLLFSGHLNKKHECSYMSGFCNFVCELISKFKIGEVLIKEDSVDIYIDKYNKNVLKLLDIIKDTIVDISLNLSEESARDFKIKGITAKE